MLLESSDNQAINHVGLKRDRDCYGLIVFTFLQAVCDMADDPY